jgi:hypothetical protein
MQASLRALKSAATRCVAVRQEPCGCRFRACAATPSTKSLRRFQQRRGSGQFRRMSSAPKCGIVPARPKRRGRPGKTRNPSGATPCQWSGPPGECRRGDARCAQRTCYNDLPSIKRRLSEGHIHHRARFPAKRDIPHVADAADDFARHVAVWWKRGLQCGSFGGPRRICACR